MKIFRLDTNLDGDDDVLAGETEEEVGEMNEIKLFEVRDVGTSIPVAALNIMPALEQERWLMKRAGYGQKRYIILFGLNCDCPVRYDPYRWNNRTLINAHSYIREHWDELRGGEVIDVEYILGERTEPKISERTEYERISLEMAEGLRNGNQ